MPKIFVRQSTALFSCIILVLLILCVGLLVAVLKGQLYHENTAEATVGSSQRISATTLSTTNAPCSDVIGGAITNLTTSELENATVGAPTDKHFVHETWENFRLPSFVIPMHYDLLLHPNLETDNFTGSVDIMVNVTKPVDHFIVHAYKLNISESKIRTNSDREDKRLKRSFLYDPNEYYVVELESEIPPGIYDLFFQFSGTLIGSIVGLYKSQYISRDTGETRYLATSKFQPTYARRAFPCFDEPAFKSTFTVSLVHEADYIALSNMPVEETRPYQNGNLIVTRFQKSVPMVTYLTCFIVCDFEYKGTKTSQGKQFRVYARKGEVNNTEHALEFGSKVLEYFEKYFGLEYSLPKQDMVAIPDFVSGAMEHWGVITYRETNLLYDPFKSSAQNKQRVSSVISHEMAHMWFGNLVTMEWWDDLWLNEGFASYIEYKGVNEQYPDWDMLDLFVTEDLQPVMGLDSTMNSHPIVQHVSHPDEITEIFDDISYNKGASVLRMLEFFVGQENFRKGISKFLEKYQFRNAKTADLWEEMSSVDATQNGLNISTIMKTWTEQMGFPYISVVRKANTSSIFTAKQERFVRNPDVYQKSYDSSEDFVWHVPLSFTTSNGHNGIVWLHDKDEKTFQIPGSQNEWVKFNVNQTGYYIVNYDDQQWQQLIQLLKTNHEALSPSDRSNLLFDAFLLSEAGLIKYDILLSLSTYLKKESHLIPWETAYASLVYLSQVLENTEVGSLVKRYINELTEPLYQKLGWEESEDHMSNLLRNTIIGLACHTGNKHCLTLSSTLLQNWTRGQDIPSTLRRLVYHYGMSEIGQEAQWEYMWKRYLEEGSPQERKTLLYGLAHVQVPALIHRFLEYSMDESKIRRQDFFTVLRYLAGNPASRLYTWNFLQDKWKDLVERFTLNDRYLGLVVKRICSYFTTETELLEMQRFFVKYPDAGAGTRRRKQAVENVQNNIKWLQKYKDQVKAWLLVESSSPWLHYKLPPHVVPLHYDLTLHPIIDEDYFTGSVSITIQLKNDTEHVMLHVSNLIVTKTEITSSVNTTLIPYEIAFSYEENNYWVIQFAEKLPVGQYKLHFEFSGNITNEKTGMFKVPYTDPVTNEKRFVISTQLESRYARTVFPCFDEPTFKSTFTIHIIHNFSVQALSNTMEIESKVLEDGLLETTFERSVPMVTYLICITIGNFEYKELYMESFIRLRVYSTVHNVGRTSYALKIGNELLQFFEKYFDHPYPLKKLDLIAIPGMPGGMENWGLITFGEINLLVDDKLSSSRDKLETANIVSHEIAHMWFGNLVTMSWWDDLWLNEGFATYMGRKGVQAIEPSWNYADEFVSSTLYSALKSDGSVGSHPIVNTARSTNEINDMFDEISYNKGAAILRMLETFMGEDFKKGVSKYLKKHAYGTVNTDDLWSSLTLASSQHLDIRSLMNTWTMQMNYPYIDVKQNKTDPYTLTIQQHHFVEIPESKKSLSSPSDYTWQIPLSYYTLNDSEIHFLILNSSKAWNLNVPKPEHVKFNVNFTGYYLVNYEVEQWERFTEMLKKDHNIMSQTDRANLLYDSFALASAGHLSYEIPLKLSSYLVTETQIVPWTIVYQVYSQISWIFDDEMSKEMIKHFVKTLSSDLYQKLRWKDTDDYTERNLRSLVIHLSCGCKNYVCLNEASDLLQDWMKGENKISQELLHLVYFYGMQTVNDDEIWMFMWNKYMNETSYAEKMKFLQALSNVRNKNYLKKLMTLAEDENNVLRGHYFLLMSYINNNPVGHPIMSDFIYRNWTELVTRFTLESVGLAELVKEVYSSFSTEEQLKEVQNFFRKHPNAGAGKSARVEALRKIRENIKWLKSYKSVIETWLIKNTYMPWRNVRLPRHIIPSTYDIYIHPNISTNNFTGNVNITLNVTEPSDYIVIHSDQLTFSKTEVQDAASNDIIEPGQVFPFDLNHFWVILFNESISEGTYHLYLAYRGKFTTDPEGLVKTSYTNNITQEERFLIYTQFEATFARKMFPCFDEPSMKSTFKVAVVHDPDFIVISNMPEESQIRRLDGFTVTRFIKSFPMSTYLVCIVVSDYGYTETDISYGKKLRYFAPKDRLNNTLHTVNITPEMLERFEEFYDIPYALPKLDFVSIPEFPMGGMENWGLVVLGERLLIDETTSVQDIIRSDKIVAHELAHQWFGNLVTMSWWDDIWLNEGFSTFAMYSSLRHFHPNSDELEARKKASVMMKDSSPFSRPIVKQVSGRVEIGNMFDSISYEKGASVINMLQNFMKDDFKKGLSNYLKKYAYNNAETKDLWDELSNASEMRINITEVMDTWTRQMGFPYVEIERKENTLIARQKRFLEFDDDVTDIPADNSPYGYVWKIPLACVDIDTGEEFSYWLNEPEATFPLLASPDACLKCNPNFTGYYIVNYDDNGWYRLSQKLQSNHEAFSATDRYNMLFDVTMLVQEELLVYDIALEVTRYMRKEKLRSLWKLVLKEFFIIINDHLRPSAEAYGLWKKYMVYLTQEYFEDSKKNETQSMNEFDTVVIYFACANGNIVCLEDQYEKLEKWLNEDGPKGEISTFSYILSYFGNETIWEEIWSRLHDSNNTSTEQSALGFALAQFQDRSLIERTLNNVVSDESFHPYTLYAILFQMRKNREALPVMWNTIKVNWDALAKKLNNPERSAFNNLLTSICKEFASEELLQEMKETLKLHPEVFSNEEEKICFSHIENNIEWKNTHGETIIHWLRWNVPN